ncbi:MAG: RNA polymerase sigma factor [Hyphomicrobiaceae bacterium]|nr:RNA polymerase sigma factor [Hyphomicrobiaceae bacterium]
MEASDLDLALEAKNGDGTAFRLLLERHYDMIFRLARRLLGSAVEAEDVAQEICLGLADRIASFRGESRFSTWLYRVVVNACRDHRRKQASRARIQADYMAFAAHDAADWADGVARQDWLKAALARLDEALRETALLVVGEELSHAEAAEILGIAEKTVSWRMHEVRKRLKSMVGRDTDG